MKGIPVSAAVKKKEHFPIVAIGASAGGLQALTDLLNHLPAKTGMCFVYIQHLDPDHDSKLVEILGRTTQMPVFEAKDKLKIRPDHLYVIPPNRELTLLDGHLKLATRPPRPKVFSPVNYFFTSLAENYKESVIGILLSGNGTDGTMGLRAIKAAGGITFAQDSSAQFQNMPRNAIAEEVVDLVLSPKQMGEELGKLTQQEKDYLEAIRTIDEESISDVDENLSAIIRQVHLLSGVDFGHYKINTIKRRIIRRMILLKLDSLEAYLRYLKQNTSEINQLYQDLLINVTSFFRDEEATNYLRKILLPKILKSKASDEPIRVWVPACSTGQEAYSLAVLLVEALGDRAATSNIQVFATDLSELAINKARLGIYSKDDVATVPSRLLNKYFSKIDGSYRIVKSIRDLCIFATHNVLKDPPFSRLDIVSCSNLLIYLENILQKKILSTFHYALNSTGYLVLGKSETIGQSGYLFSLVDKKYKIYAKKKDATAKAMFELSYSADGEKGSGMPRTFIKPKRTDDIDLDKEIETLLLKKYTPACVVVNQDLDIIQFRGATGLFLEPSPGKASLNLLKMARPGLSLELRNIVHKAHKSGNTELKSWIEGMPDNRTRTISIEAVPIKQDTDSSEQYFLVIFDEQIHAANSGTTNLKDKRVKQLEGELTALREDMRSILEAQEAANEELQSVNEEIVSSNEELQSINEELETSKEELESSNEELITINQELQKRNEQLAEVQEYSEAIFTTIRESLLVLDKDLRIKNANICFYRTFMVTEEQTEGRMLYELGNKQWNIPRLKELLEEIIPRNGSVTDFEVEHNFPGIGNKVMLLNARRIIRKLHNEHLILVAIEDITHFRQTERLLKQREEWFRHTADFAPMMIWVADTNKKLEFVNKSWLSYRGLTYEEAIGRSWMEDMHPDDEKRVKKIFDAAFAAQKEFTVEYRLKQADGYTPILSKGTPNYAPDKTFTGYIGTCVELPH